MENLNKDIKDLSKKILDNPQEFLKEYKRILHSIKTEENMLPDKLAHLKTCIILVYPFLGNLPTFDENDELAIDNDFSSKDDLSNYCNIIHEMYFELNEKEILKNENNNFRI
jgi:hypothetical protein